MLSARLRPKTVSKTVEPSRVPRVRIPSLRHKSLITLCVLVWTKICSACRSGQSGDLAYYAVSPPHRTHRLCRSSTEFPSGDKSLDRSKCSSAVSAGAFINLGRTVLKANVAVGVGNHLLLLRQIPEVIALGRLHRPMSNIALHAINRPAFLQSLDGEFVADVVETGTKTRLLSIVKQVRPRDQPSSVLFQSSRLSGYRN